MLAWQLNELKLVVLSKHSPSFVSTSNTFASLSKKKRTTVRTRERKTEENSISLWIAFAPLKTSVFLLILLFLEERDVMEVFGQTRAISEWNCVYIYMYTHRHMCKPYTELWCFLEWGTGGILSLRTDMVMLAALNIERMQKATAITSSLIKMNTQFELPSKVLQPSVLTSALPPV